MIRFGAPATIKPVMVGGNHVPAGSIIRCGRGHVVCRAARDLSGLEINTWHDAFGDWKQRPKQIGDDLLCKHLSGGFVCGHAIDFADWSPGLLYAEAGEVVTCEGADHPIATVATDLFHGDARSWDQLRDWTLKRLPSPDRPIPRCPTCRSAWMRGTHGQPGVLHFRTGWRLDLPLAGGGIVIRDVPRRWDQIMAAGQTFEQQTGLSSTTGEPV